jgi:hypothetical protein
MDPPSFHVALYLTTGQLLGGFEASLSIVRATCVQTNGLGSW